MMIKCFDIEIDYNLNREFNKKWNDSQPLLVYDSTQFTGKSWKHYSYLAKSNWYKQREESSDGNCVNQYWKGQ